MKIKMMLLSGSAVASDAILNVEKATKVRIMHLRFEYFENKDALLRAWQILNGLSQKPHEVEAAKKDIQCLNERQMQIQAECASKGVYLD